MKIAARISPHEELNESLIQFGEPSTEILKEIETGKYRYVLMGARKRNLLSRFVESNVYKIISHSPVPVLTIAVS